MQKYHGVIKNQDLHPNLITREVRPLSARFRDFIEEKKGFPLIIAGALSLALPMTTFPQIADIIMVLGLFYFLLVRNKQSNYILRKPFNKNKKLHGNGMLLLGNERGTQIEVWLSNEDMRTHVLLFGTTGSGKTRALLGFLYQAILSGSGVVYVDGKGDNTVWWLVFDLCRRADRIDQLLLMNYLTEDDSKEDDYEDSEFERITNTNNPFAYGSSEQLRSLIVGLMRESGGDGAMWKGRASAMLAGLLKALCDLRDKNQINLDVDQIRKHFALDTIVELRDNKFIKDASKAAIGAYLAEIPGWSEDDAKMKRIKPEVYKQHGFLLMQLTEVMADLSDTYGHIFDTPRGEVDFKDVVFNRRILFVMLPSLTKDPDALQGLGKLVVSGIRAALGPALGNRVEGSKGLVIDQKPTNSTEPFYIILDEYGYYSVPGFAVVAAQARSLGVCVVFAGQDYPSFKKSDENEAKSVVANTGLKICMKLEDPDETAKIIIDRAGESEVAVTSGHEKKKGSTYKDQGNARIERRNRINLRDLVDQEPGEAHVIYGDNLIRCRMFYADPPDVQYARLNKYIMVNPPEPSITTKTNKAFEFYKNRLLGKENEYANEVVETDSELSDLFAYAKYFNGKKIRQPEASRLAVGLFMASESIESDLPDTDKPKDQATQSDSHSDTDDSSKVSHSEKSDDHKEVDINDLEGLEEMDDDFFGEDFSTTDESDFLDDDFSDFEGHKGKEPALDDDPDDFLSDLKSQPTAPNGQDADKEQVEVPALRDIVAPESSIKNKADDYKSAIKAAFEVAVRDSIEKKQGRKLNSEEAKALSPESQLNEIEKTQNDPLVAKEEAAKGIKIIEGSFEYPKKIKAKKSSKEEVQGTLQDLLNTINNKK